MATTAGILSKKTRKITAKIAVRIPDRTRMPRIKAVSRQRRVLRSLMSTSPVSALTHIEPTLSPSESPVIMMFFAVGVGVYAFATFFGGGNPIDGWTSTMLFLSAGFFGIFILLGIILKYLSVVVDLVFNKQKYFVESVEKVNNRR